MPDFSFLHIVKVLMSNYVILYYCEKHEPTNSHAHGVKIGPHHIKNDWRATKPLAYGVKVGPHHIKNDWRATNPLAHGVKVGPHHIKND